MKSRLLIITCILLSVSVIGISFATPPPADPIKEAEYEKKLSLRSTQTAQQQIENGVSFLDVTCNDKKIPMLKYSENVVVCIYEDSREKLEQRQWGISHKANQDGIKPGCTDYRFIMNHQNNPPSKSEISKKYRIAVKDIARDTVFWKPVELEYSENIIKLIARGAFQEHHQERVAKELSMVSKVTSVDIDRGACS